jgi:hypothetical protein
MSEESTDRVRLSLRAVAFGAAVAAGVLIVAVLAVRLIGEEGPANVDLLVVLALFTGFPVGGVVAYRSAGVRPVAHAAAAAGLAWVVIGAVVVSRGITFAGLVTLALLVQVTVGRVTP